MPRTHSEQQRHDSRLCAPAPGRAERGPPSPRRRRGRGVEVHLAALSSPLGAAPTLSSADAPARTAMRLLEVAADLLHRAGHATRVDREWVSLHVRPRSTPRTDLTP